MVGIAAHGRCVRPAWGIAAALVAVCVGCRGTSERVPDAGLVRQALAEERMGPASRRLVDAGEAAFPAIFAVLREEPDRKQYDRAMGLVRAMDGTTSPRYLMDVVTSAVEKDDVRMTAALMLERFTHREDVGMLIAGRALADPCHKIRANCQALVITEMRCFGPKWEVPPDAVDLLRMAARDESPVVRRCLAERIGFLGWRAWQDGKELAWCREILRSLSSDGDAQVRTAARKALSVIRHRGPSYLLPAPRPPDAAGKADST